MDKEPLTTRMATRLGWTIYYVCLVIACVWVGAMYVYLASAIPEGEDFPWSFFAIVAGSGAVLTYAAGRAFRYVLSDE